MLLKFKGMGEYFIFWIDRVNKSVRISSNATNYRQQLIKWDKLFDSEEEKTKTEKLTDFEFAIYLYGWLKKRPETAHYEPLKMEF